MSRRAARITAVEVLYGADVRGEPAPQLLDERDDADPYARHLVDNVHARRAELDGLIADHARSWRPERMSPVDLNVLRVAAFELIEGDVPPAAVIDEAIDIAKRFSGEEAGRFVNGVLEGLRQSLVGGGGAGGGGGDASASGGSAGVSGKGGGSGVGTGSGTDPASAGAGTDVSGNGERPQMR